MTKKVQLIIGSTRQNRISPTIASWIEAQVANYDDLELEIIDLKSVDLPFFDEPTSPSVASGTSEIAKAWSAKISTADAFIILSPEYNAGYPGVLKNAIDYLLDEWKHRPLTIVTYGYGGGLSSAAQLKQVFNRIGSDIIDSGVAIDIGAGILQNNLEQYEAPLAIALGAIIAYRTAGAEVLASV
ncbi:MAG: NADPH-dependent FMN reductase [Candidatus Saccharibacteria bacterium]